MPTRNRTVPTVGLRRLPLTPPGSILLCLIAAPLAAQKPLRGVAPDTLGLPGDTVRLAVEQVEGMDGCQIIGHAVVRNGADLRRLRRYPQCAKAAPPLEGRTVVGVDINADCQALYRIDAFRSAKRRELRVRLRISGGGCRGLLPRYEWISLPALPLGWSMRFTEAAADERTPFRPPRLDPARLVPPLNRLAHAKPRRRSVARVAPLRLRGSA